MRVVMWIAEGTWETCVDAAAPLLSDDATVTLVHVSAPAVEAVARGAHTGLLGRRRHGHGPSLAAISEEEAQGLLALARERLARTAELQARRGRPEDELIAVAQGADLLVLVRDGAAAGGPASLGPRTRFVLDHAPCPVLLVPGSAGPPPPRPPGPPLPSDGR